MKLRCLLPALVCLCALTVSAQTFTDDLGTKRTNLIYQVRALGPLAPTNWVTSTYTWVPNLMGALPDDLSYAMGNYAYVSHNGWEWFYGYANSGLWIGSDPAIANPATRMDSFGLHDVDPAYPYKWVTDAENYNIAGLRYLSLTVIVGLSGQGAPLGWTLTPGTTLIPNLGPYDYARTFDLAQNVERPVFKAADYWFGYWPNFPQDATLPQPQNSLSQNAGAFFVTPVNTWLDTRIWVKEGVYRPGLTLQPGYSSPRLYTFMEQYADALYQTDPVTGTVPRTSTPNWNNVGRINTNSAVRTGVVDVGYYVRTSQPGKAVLTTRPLEDGSYGELPLYTLAMFVDKNRDGTLDTNDVTTASNPHVFWVNNDVDRYVFEYDPANFSDQLDLNPAQNTTNDAFWAESFQQIPCRRDLEDYDRLHLRGLKELCRDLPTGCTVTLSWKQVLWGAPAICLFKSVENDGGTKYLTDLLVADSQVSPTQAGDTTPRSEPKPLAMGSVDPANTLTMHTDSSRGTNDYFIYCGTGRGAGELALRVTRQGTNIFETTLFLEIRDVKELYERWTVGDAEGAAPYSDAVLATDGLPAGASATAFLADTNQPYILFVHGWNMEVWDKHAFAETAFKRLYWQGYTNRFGFFRWPTANGFTGKYADLLFDARNFDRSEFSAWRTGEPLRKLLVNLNQRYPGKVYLLAHSMGNIAAGEALALQAERVGGAAIVNSYVASQAAVSLHCYNGTNNHPDVLLQFQYDHPSTVIPFLLYGPSTPNIYVDWLSTNRLAASRRVNFFNTNDFALAMPLWGFNQILKPANGYNGLDTKLYTYNGFAGQTRLPGITFANPFVSSHLIPSPARRGLTRPFARVSPGYFMSFELPFPRALDFEYRLPDMYEAMSFAAESRVQPLGVVGDQRAIEESVNLHSVWVSDVFPTDDGRIFARHKWHSGQFRMENSEQKAYWKALLGLDGFRIFLQ